MKTLLIKLSCKVIKHYLLKNVSKKLSGACYNDKVIGRQLLELKGIYNETLQNDNSLFIYRD